MAGGWTTKQIPDQTGRRAVVTGANSGLGIVVATELARAGAEVILACRDAGRGAAAVEAICSGLPGPRSSPASSISPISDRSACSPGGWPRRPGRSTC